MATVLETSRPTLRIPLTPFQNEPLTDFTNAENARKMKRGGDQARSAQSWDANMTW